MDIEKYLQSGKLEQYVLGLASSEERKEIEQLSKEYPEIDAYICDLHSCMNSCSEAYKIPVSEEPDHHSKCKTFYLKNKTNLVAEPKENPTLKKSKYISWRTGVASVVMLGLCSLSFYLYQDRQAVSNETALLLTQLHHLKMDNESLKNESEKMMQQYAVLKDVNTHYVSLHGSKNAPQAHGIVYWNNEHGKAYLSICKLPKPPDGHQYHVWAVHHGEYQMVGTLNPSSVDILHHLSFTKECDGFCVTLEKAGTASNPTPESMFVKGEM